MASGQVLLDTMELLNQELQLQTAEADVTRGIVALNRAQDYFESLAALRPNMLGSAIGTVTTTNNIESTAFPTGVLRIDKLQYIDSGTSRPAWDLLPIEETGGHGVSQFWPFNLASSTTSGKPRGYWTNGTNIYWDPLPSGTHTVRWYGLSVAADISAAGTFAYPDIVLLPLAGFAVKLMRTGVDDPTGDVTSLANQAFESVLDVLASFRREGGKGFRYRFHHDT